ncbi:hypothetical protein H2200_011751 [Cladophialophora chaetospira]|uniref:Uncharacterized protein n=1 Tax=Cladophialophora chaetospira TaxID=386627 RepID=A0AA38WYP1_9EURO|nr:hypothetical protein H2200_011751 [Cladophialophora chaetospira]
MSDSQAVVDPRSISARSRRTSVSAIPRPVSGTSRHATPTISRAGTRDSSAGPTILEDAHKHRKSWHPNEGFAPSSFRTPPLHLSLPTEHAPHYKQQSRQSLPGTQHKVYGRNLSTHSLNAPGTNIALHNLKQASSTNALPKSRTLNSLLSHPRETTPGRRLLRPIDPPLPRTQTLANLSCFSPSDQTSPPRKAKSISISLQQQNSINSSKLNIADVLGESRMTQKEMNLMKQVQREAAANRARLRSSHQLHNVGQDSRLDASTPGREASTLNLSLHDAANTQRLEGMKRRTLPGRPLFINSTLANQNWQEADLPTDTTVTSIGTMTSSEPSRGDENDPRSVYVAEPTSYWTGRYVSLCDRLQLAELNRPKPSPSESNEKQIDRLFETSARVRMYSALIELRDHCKTTEALRSFEEFEGSLLKRMGVSRQSLHRAGALAYSKDGGKTLTTSRTMPLAMKVPSSPGTPSSATSRVSSVNAEAVMTGTSKSVHGEGSLAKSKTTGNLTSLIPMIPKRRYVVKTGPAPKSKSNRQDGHRRKTSYFDRSPETLVKAMKEHEQRAARRATTVHRRSTSQGFSPNGPSNLQSAGKATMTAEQCRPQPCSSQATVGPFHEISPSLTITSLESGHGLPPSQPPTRIGVSRIEMVRVASGGNEKVIRSIRKPEKQFSGDRVKNLLGAGVREVKKMGRRVSGMSWPGSGEE